MDSISLMYSNDLRCLDNIYGCNVNIQSCLVACLFASVLFFAETNLLLAGKVHLITVGDYADPQLGKFAGADVSHISTTFELQLAESDINHIDLSSGLSLESVLSAIRRLPVDGDDAVVFYFSGHGAFDVKKGHYLIVTNPVTHRRNEILRTQIVFELQKKRARLTVILTDACYARRDLVIDTPSAVAPASLVTSPLFRRLFFGCRGTVDVNSCSQGELSYTFTNSQSGSIFTAMFASILEEHSENGSLSWDEVLRLTSSATASVFRKVFSDEFPIPDGSDIPQTTQTPARLAFHITPAQGTLNSDSLKGTFGSGSSTAGTRFGAYVESVNEGGVRVTKVMPKSPASEFHFASGQPAVFESGDVILVVNGVHVRDEPHFRSLVAESPDVMEFSVRSPRGPTIYRCFAKLFSGADSGTPEVSDSSFSMGPRFGAHVVSVASGGVKVTSIVANTPSARFRMPNGQVSYLESGDIIVSVNGTAVRDESHYRELVAASPQLMIFTVRSFRDSRLYHCTATLLY